MLHAMEVSVAELKRAVEVQHGCKATVFQSMPIKKTFSGADSSSQCIIE
jgi:hypothetical protein